MSATRGAKDSRPHVNSQVNSITITNTGRVPNVRVLRSNDPLNPWRLREGKSVTINQVGTYYVQDGSQRNYFFVVYDSANATLTWQDTVAPGPFEVTFNLNGSQSGSSVPDSLPLAVADGVNTHVTPPHISSGVKTIVIKNIGNAVKTEVVRGAQTWPLPKGAKFTLQDAGTYSVLHQVGAPYFAVTYDWASVAITSSLIPSNGNFSITCTLSASHRDKKKQ